MAFRVHQAPPLGTVMSQAERNSDIINNSITINEIEQFFTPSQLEKFAALRALNITLVNSDYQYVQNNVHNWTLNDATTNKLAGWCNSALLLFCQLSGVNVVYDYTAPSGDYPQFFSLFEDPKATIGSFWLQNDYRDALGTFHSAREAGWENMRIRALTADEAALTANLLPVVQNSSMVLDQTINLSSQGWTIVLPPAFEFGAFSSIDEYDQNNPGTLLIRRLLSSEWEDFGFTLFGGEYYTYPSPPVTTGSVELAAFHSALPIRIGIYIKAGIPYAAQINEVFQIISESGLPNSVGYNTIFEGAINENYEVANPGDQYKIVAPVSQLPLPVNASTVSLNPLQQGDFKGSAPFGTFDDRQRTIGAYYRSRSLINDGYDKSGTVVSSVFTVAKAPNNNNSFVVTTLEQLNRLVNANLEQVYKYSVVDNEQI